MGLSRVNRHKHRTTRGKRKPCHKKQTRELGHRQQGWPAADTGLPGQEATGSTGPGAGVGTCPCGSECCTRQRRTIDVVYRASHNELVRPRTPVQSCAVLLDSTACRHSAPGPKKAKLTPEEEAILNKKRSKTIRKKYGERKKHAHVSSLPEEQFQQGKLPARVASRPGQCGRADGCVLEGKEPGLYARKIKTREGR